MNIILMSLFYLTMVLIGIGGSPNRGNYPPGFTPPLPPGSPPRTPPPTPESPPPLTPNSLVTPGGTPPPSPGGSTPRTPRRSPTSPPPYTPGGTPPHPPEGSSPLRTSGGSPGVSTNQGVRPASPPGYGLAPLTELEIPSGITLPPYITQGPGKRPTTTQETPVNKRQRKWPPGGK